MKLRVLVPFLLLFLLTACTLPTETGGEIITDAVVENMEATIEAQATTIAELRTELTEMAGTRGETEDAEPDTTPTPRNNPTEAATELPTPTYPTAEPTVIISNYTGAFEDDFSENLGNFAPQSFVLRDSGLVMGPFESCALTSAQFPVGCVAVCVACGQPAVYNITVDTNFYDGVSDRFFGVILRFVDENGDQAIDDGDYVLGWVYNAFQGVWRLYEHDPEKVANWLILEEGQANMPDGIRQPTTLELVASEKGTKFDIIMNGISMLRLSSGDKEAGELQVNSIPDSGYFAFWSMDAGIMTIYDNFTFADEP